MKLLSLLEKTGSVVVPGGVVLLIVTLACCDKQSQTSITSDETASKANSSNESVPPLTRLDEFRATQRKMANGGATDNFIVASNSKIIKDLEKLSTQSLVELLLSLDPSNIKEDFGLIFKVLNVLAARDPEAALGAVELLPTNTPGARNPVFYARLVKADPAAVCRWLERSGRKNVNNMNVAIGCAWEIGKNAPDDAEALLARCDEKFRKSIGSSMLSEVAKSDPQRAFQIVERFPPEQRAEGYVSALNGISVVDGGLAFELLAKMNDASVAFKAHKGLFLSWIKQDPGAAGEALATIPSSSIQSVLEDPQNLTALISRNVELATNALDQMVFTEDNAKIFAQAAHELGGKDPAAAMAWLASFPDSPKKGELIREVVTSRAAADPETNVPLILDEQSPYRNDAIVGAGTAWGRVDAGKALECVASLPVDEQKLYAMSVLTASSQSNLDATVECISANSLPATIRDSTEYEGMVTSTASNFAARDLQEAVKWATSLSGGISEAAVSGVASQWAKKDPGATGEWILQLPGGPARNAAIQALVGQIESTDPAAARQWRASVTK